MRSIVLLFLMAALLAGCQAKPKAPAAAAAPKTIATLTDQKVVWECPSCGMDYDGPGTCSMDGATLVKTDISYICPVDNKPVDHAGPCPRCNANAKIVRTAVAAAPAPGGQNGGTPSGS